MHQLLLQYIILLILGVLFITYATLNLSLSYAPENLNEIPQNYGKTYAIQVTTASDNSQETKDNIIRTTSNATTLMLLSMVGGLYLVLFSIYRISVSSVCSKKNLS